MAILLAIFSFIPTPVFILMIVIPFKNNYIINVIKTQVLF